MNIGTTRQLLADDELIESMNHVFQVLNPGRKHSGNPLIVADKPWETGDWLYATTVLLDPAAAGKDRFRIWYYGFMEEWGDRDYPGLLLAHSEDGIHWEKPDLGLVSLNGSKANNGLFLNNSRGWIVMEGLCYDPSDPDPSRSYKALAFVGAEEPQVRRDGWGAYFSPDGLHWQPYEKNPVLKYDHVTVCEVLTTIYNEQSANPRPGHPLDRYRYYAPAKYSSYTCGGPLSRAYGKMRRASGLMTSSDFIPNDFTQWSPNHLILQPDEVDDFLAGQRIMAQSPALNANHPEEHRAEFYEMGLMPYGDILLGFLWVFDLSGDVEGKGQDGTIHVQLVGTRDLRTWKRLGERRPLLSPGSPGDWDAGLVYPCNRPVVVGDEIRMYYSGANRGHGWKPGVRQSIGMASWRLDGFVSINASNAKGTLTTKVFTFSGRKLFINAESAGGEVLVEMLDESEGPIPGFTMEDCVPFRGDGVREEVKWKSDNRLADLAGKPVKLRFRMTRAKLYSFQFLE
ncbi:MAG: hypothetical protein HY318_00245 [Armatimonadetes bacterium]|nr:hypothetical protein [Armatimonadota bacterium]